jgi:hypothetical protein
MVVIAPATLLILPTICVTFFIFDKDIVPISVILEDAHSTRGGRICPTSYSVYVNRNDIRFKIVKNHSIDRFSKLRGKGKENDKRARRQSFLWLYLKIYIKK